MVCVVSADCCFVLKYPSSQYFVGHVDAGKSTLMGHLLFLKGNVDQKLMHKYKTESHKLGKSSFAFAWVLDQTGEERDRYVGRTNIQTRNRS